MKTETRTVRTNRGLKEYTYLGCPLTRNRTPWCFRLCNPDTDGHGECGRIAPHSFKSKIQLGIEAHNQKLLEEHLSKLERMYLSTPCNDFQDPGVSITMGAAEIVIPMQDAFLDATRSVGSSVCFRAMDDAARLAVNSTVKDVLMATVAFNIHLVRPSAAGELIARGQLIDVSEDDFLARAVLVDAEGQEIGRGSGSYAKSDVSLTSEVGYS
jgi:acyl-coenzyme A thioesterase PaaI-like protein